MAAVLWFARAIRGPLVEPSECRRERMHGARLLIQIRNQTMAVGGGAKLAEIAAIHAVDLRAGESANFYAIVSEK